MRAILEATRLDKGTVDPELALTYRNTADPKVLQGGKEIFGAHEEMIAGADHEVLLQTYVWDSSNGLRDPLDLVGALVHGNLDDEAFAGWKPHRWSDDMAGEVDNLQLDPRYVQIETVGYDQGLLGAMHVKALVVDARKLLVTGANVQPFFDDDVDWFDAAFVMEGEVALGVRSQFEEALDRCHPRIALPPPPDLPAPEGAMPMLVASRGSQDLPLPHLEDTPLTTSYAALMENAQERIRILTPNLNAPTAKREVLDALERKVTVQMVLSRGFNDGREKYPLQGGTNEQVVEWLQRQVDRRRLDRDLLQVRWFSRDGKAPIHGNGHGASHAKYLSADDQVAAARTANDDTQSLFHSREINVLVDSAEVTRNWDQDLFEPVWELAVPAEWPLR